MEIVPNSPTIQKPNCRQFPELSMAGFTDALRPDKFTGVHFKKWQYKTELWLTTMKVFQISKGKPEGTMSEDDPKFFEEANTVFVGCILSIFADRLCDVFMHIKDGKKLSLLGEPLSVAHHFWASWRTWHAPCISSHR
jgi:hypothetical protein